MAGILGSAIAILDKILQWGQEVYIDRPSTARTEMGGMAEAGWRIVVGPAPASIQNPSSRVIEQYNRRNLEVDWVIYVVASAESVREGDRVRTTTGKKYAIVSAENQAGLSTLWRIGARETK